MVSSPFLPQSPLPAERSPRAHLDRIFRVDLAGEQGAEAIYAGQLWALGPRHPLAFLIQDMASHEANHRQGFQKYMADHQGRPSLLGPLWNGLGLALGAVTGLLGGQAAMACTTAVESVINAHYASQIDQVQNTFPDLAQFLRACQEEEMHHHDIGLAHGASEAPYAESLQALIRASTRLAVSIAKRV